MGSLHQLANHSIGYHQTPPLKYVEYLLYIRRSDFEVLRPISKRAFVGRQTWGLEERVFFGGLGASLPFRRNLCQIGFRFVWLWVREAR